MNDFFPAVIFLQGPGSVKHSIGIDRFAKQLRYDSISFIPAVNLNNSTATAPVTNAVVVEIAGMIFPLIFFTVFRSVCVIP